VTTVGDWLAAREPAPPPVLRARLETVLGEALSRDRRDSADACLAAGERLLSAVLGDVGVSRSCALDLLAADALVTYAFEAAAESPGDLAARASRAMHRIASLAAKTSEGVDA
jgi:polysaccharide deacetylase 2 family uncharacterized protein YibQ